MNANPAKAVAIIYDGTNTPTLTAKGIDTDAQEIIRIAQENGIPLCDNTALVDLLGQLELGESIPEALYLAIAHIITFAYKLQLDASPP